MSQNYSGKFANTIHVDCHYRCSCGGLVPYKVATAVDMACDPLLALRATETELSDTINVVVCAACGLQQKIHIPFTFHFAREEAFALVLNDCDRYRELEERSRITRELMAEERSLANGIPEYMQGFPIVYGPKGLTQYLRDVQTRHHGNSYRMAEAAEASEASPEVTEVLQLTQQNHELDRRCEELQQQIAQLQVLQISAQSSEGKTVEILVDDSELDVGDLEEMEFDEALECLSFEDDTDSMEIDATRERRFDSSRKSEASGMIDLGALGKTSANEPTVVLTGPKIAKLQDDENDLEKTIRELEELGPADAAPVFADIVTDMGEQASDTLMALLDDSCSHLRHGAALALCEMRHEKGIDAVCGLLLEDDILWREYARALGSVGVEAIPSLVSHLDRCGTLGQTRVVWALGHIASQGYKTPIETLSRSKDITISRIANAALQLEERLSDGAAIPVERDLHSARFSDAFYGAMQGQQQHETGPLPRV